MDFLETSGAPFAGCDTVSQLLERIRGHFDVHATYHMALSARTRVDSPYVRTTYPGEWVARYLLAGYVAIDPIVGTGFQRALPFDWSELAMTPESSALMADAISHGLGTSGYSVPVIDRNGRRGLFSVNSHAAGARWEAFLREHSQAFVELAHLAHRLAVAEIFGERDIPHLTAREREVLLWTARGKDYKAIAIIVGISPHTAKAYLKSARYKLDSATLSQAVAKAISLRLISD